MWNISNRRKNTYLQSRVQVMDPALLNKCIEKARTKSEKILPKKGYLNVQLLPLEPKLITSQVERCKTHLSFGLLTLPRVLKEVSVKNLKIQCKALSTLSDLLANPLELYRAIYEFDVVKRLEAVFLWHMAPHKPENVRLINLILINLAPIAENFEGAWRMVVRYELIDAIYCLIRTSKCLKEEAANILSLMSSHPSVVDVMLIQGHLNRTHNLIKQFDKVVNLYIYLSNLLERAPAPGMDLLTFDFLIPKLCVRDKFLPYVLKCLSFLLNTEQGHDIFDRIDAVLILYNLLKDETVDGMLLENTVLALKNCTLRKIGLWRCREFWGLPVILVKHAHDRENDILQLYCLQTLRQITAMPSVKNFVRKVCKKHIKTIECRQEFVSIAKKTLLEWLRKKTYINIEPKDESDEEPGNASEDLSKSETFSYFDDDNVLSEKSSKIIQAPKPIVYRLDYGHICAEKTPSKICLKVAHSNKPICSNSLSRFMETASLLKKLREPTRKPIRHLEQNIGNILLENAPQFNVLPPSIVPLPPFIPDAFVLAQARKDKVEYLLKPPPLTPANTPTGYESGHLNSMDQLIPPQLRKNELKFKDFIDILPIPTRDTGNK